MPNPILPFDSKILVFSRKLFEGLANYSYNLDWSNDLNTGEIKLGGTPVTIMPETKAAPGHPSAGGDPNAVKRLTIKLNLDDKLKKFYQENRKKNLYGRIVAYKHLYGNNDPSQEVSFYSVTSAAKTLKNLWMVLQRDYQASLTEAEANKLIVEANMKKLAERKAKRAQEAEKRAEVWDKLLAGLPPDVSIESQLENEYLNVDLGNGLKVRLNVETEGVVVSELFVNHMFQGSNDLVPYLKNLSQVRKG